MDLTLLASLAVIHTIALISPGPDFAIIVKMATQQSRQTALACAVGISLAILIHTLLSLLGISLMIKQSPVAYTLVQFIGVSYLAWMGFHALKSACIHFLNNTPINQTTTTNDVATKTELHNQNMSHFAGFKIGLLTNLLNPKALIFFITLFTVLITPEVDAYTKAAAASILFSLSILWFSLLALVLSKPKIQQQLLKATNIIDALVGIIFLSVSITIFVGLIKSLI
ncbi:LysE family translocator [Shewanella aestuarii]|uniref:LysE family translocator n=1 Tax=Shewanella aestuarii TaxID=1028752 RepID=A0A6G9QK28_9GAMM|nr:LysE family translocator [Shewanella aestuarii]QIR14822.1 LysE family translocator [Shewanella aestuarii]